MVLDDVLPETETTDGPPEIEHEVIGRPPLFEGRAQVNATEVPVDVAEIAVGAPGIETAFMVSVPITVEVPPVLIQRTSTV
jgi:hypothetical protein